MRWRRHGNTATLRRSDSQAAPGPRWLITESTCCCARARRPGSGAGLASRMHAGTDPLLPCPPVRHAASPSFTPGLKQDLVRPYYEGRGCLTATPRRRPASQKPCKLEALQARSPASQKPRKPLDAPTPCALWLALSPSCDRHPRVPPGRNSPPTRHAGCLLCFTLLCFFLHCLRGTQWHPPTAGLCDARRRRRCNCRVLQS
jgi:hypothetical protein